MPGLLGQQGATPGTGMTGASGQLDPQAWWNTLLKIAIPIAQTFAGQQAQPGVGTLGQQGATPGTGMTGASGQLQAQSWWSDALQVAVPIALSLLQAQPGAGMPGTLGQQGATPGIGPMGASGQLDPQAWWNTLLKIAIPIAQTFAGQQAQPRVGMPGQI
jgi:hypothetical protein